MNQITVNLVLLVFFPLTKAINELCSLSLTEELKWRREPEDCSSAYMCLLGRKLTYSCPKGYVFGSDRLVCVRAGSAADDCSATEFNERRDQGIEEADIVLSDCKEGQYLADEENCATYHECVNLLDGNTTYIRRECPYPQLFDAKNGKCDSYKNVDCNEEQIIPKNPCDYQALQCTSVHCVPCNIRYPTCTGLPDGMNPWLGREWSPDYVVCDEERVAIQGQCKGEKEPQVFHPEKRTCVILDEKTVLG